MVSRQRRLGFVLLSPPTTSGARTLNMLERAQGLLGFESHLLANLFAKPCKDLRELTELGVRSEDWQASRAALGEFLDVSDALFLAWGMSKPSGAARRLLAEQLDWLVQEATVRGHEQVWTVGGQPRHPSRWHQYVSVHHGRAGRGSLDDRLARVLVRQSLASCPV